MLEKVSSLVRRVAALAICALALNTAVSLRAENDPRLYAVELTAAIQTAPASITVTWPVDANATGYSISRKLPAATSWSSLTTLVGTATSYTDTNVTIGASYEYRVSKSSTIGVGAFGYILAGINAPLVESRGKLVLVVDSTYAATLAPELTRLQQDLTGDGWSVIRKDVSPTLSAPQVKALIKTEYDADRANVKSVFLFGHVAVPRSGDINPDGHPNHQGAWTADSYYADMDGVWTDSTVNDTSAERPENWNLPGDGKFDQGEIPSNLELAVGRVDLSNMTCFANKTPSRSELDLLRAYLNKDHNFRYGLINVPRRGLVSDNFGEASGEAFAATGWRSFAPMFGATNTVKVGYGEYFPTLSAQPYLFSYACGGGSYYTCNGVGGSDDFSTNEVKTVFTMLFGSYFGDWDNESNFLRAILGSGNALTVSWSGRPLWFYHQMALGGTVGSSALLSQNNANGGVYERQNYGTRFVNNVLLGDPTLRLHPVLPPTSLAGTVSGSSATLTWTASTDTAIQGYHVYRATNAAGPFTRLTSSPITTTSFTDSATVANAFYMVRAVKLESTPSGTYFNPSQGVFYPNGTVLTTPPPSTTTTTNSTTTTTNTAPITTTTNSTTTVTNSTSTTITASRFVKADTTTSGNWTNVYGAQGNWIYSASPMIASYATVTPVSASTWVWNDQPTRAAAPLLPYGTTNRIAACWYANSQYSLDVSIKDGQAHRVSAYFLDWDVAGRQEKVELVNAVDGSVISTQTLTNFSNGIYLVWDVVGNVRIRVTPIVGNAVVSALYFDATPAVQTAPTGPTTAARFTAFDLTTRGNWTNVYGADASIIARDTARNASYATVKVSQQSEWAYTTDGKDLRAPVKSDLSGRVAGVWYSYYPTTNAFYIDVTITDGNAHQMALYAFDWWNEGEQMQVDVLNADTGAVLDTRTLLSFYNGKYIVWDVKGKIRLRLSCLAGPRAAASGLFLGPASAPL